MISESLRYLAIVASNVSDFPRARTLLAEALTMHTEDNDDEGASMVLVQLATVLYNEGHFADARAELERVLPIVMSSDHRYREAVVVSNLAAIVVQQGELGYGRRLVIRGLELCIDLEDLEGIATAHNIAGEIQRRVGDLQGAEASLRKALETTIQQGFEVVTSDSLLSLALIDSVRGHHDDALAHIDEAVNQARQADSTMAVARALVGRGYVQLAAGQADTATESLRAGLDGARTPGLGVPRRRSGGRPGTRRGDARRPRRGTAVRRAGPGDAGSPGSARRDPALRDLPVVLAGPRRLR